MAKTSIGAKTAWISQSSFMLGVSMGSQNHEGESLEAIISRINKGSFSSGIIDLADTLNRYRYIVEGKSEEEAISMARSEGDAWLERNKNILAKLTVPSTIRRWDEWLNHPEYAKTLKYIRRLYYSSAELQSALNEDIEKFYLRKCRELNITDRSRALSQSYYLEEMAVATIMLEEQPSVVLYPGKQLDCFRLIRSGKIKNAPESLTNSPYSRLVIHSYDKSPVANQNETTVEARL